MKGPSYVSGLSFVPSVAGTDDSLKFTSRVCAANVQCRGTTTN